MGKFEVTSIDTLKSYNTNGKEVELPPFGEGQPFYAILRRPSMLKLAQSGKIPNTLIASATKLFEGGARNALDAADLKSMPEMFEVLEIMCDAAFVSPTYKQIKEAGIQLTDDQYMFVLGYAQAGVKTLEKFRS